VRRLKASVNDPDSYDKTMEDLKRVKLLYIDDFLKVGGGERPREGDLNVAFELLNARYSNPQLLTIISTERTPQEIMGFDEAIASRINERCGKFRLTFEGEQKNQRKRKQGGMNSES
jgi:DNA replication protein DnaC